jgi:hypothetical protein
MPQARADPRRVRLPGGLTDGVSDVRAGRAMASARRAGLPFFAPGLHVGHEHAREIGLAGNGPYQPVWLLTRSMASVDLKIFNKIIMIRTMVALSPQPRHGKNKQNKDIARNSAAPFISPSCNWASVVCLIAYEPVGSASDCDRQMPVRPEGVGSRRYEATLLT